MGRRCELMGATWTIYRIWVQSPLLCELGREWSCWHVGEAPVKLELLRNVVEMRLGISESDRGVRPVAGELPLSDSANAGRGAEGCGGSGAASGEIRTADHPFSAFWCSLGHLEPGTLDQRRR